MPQVRAALQINVLFVIGWLLAPFLLWVLTQYALGADRPDGGRERRCGPRHGLFGQSGPAGRDHGRRFSGRHRRLVPVALLSGKLERGPVQRTGADGGGAGDLRALASDAVLWAPRCCSAVPARWGRRSSRSASPGYYLFNAAPYVLTLVIMIATCSPTRTLGTGGTRARLEDRPNARPSSPPIPIPGPTTATCGPPTPR